VLGNVDEIVIGRGATRAWQKIGRTLDLKISDFEISRHHVRISRHDDSWELIDLGSKNGTAINGAVVTRAMLADGDLIEIGGAMLIYRDECVPSGTDIGDLDLGGTATLPPAFRTLSVELEKRAADLQRIAPSMVPILIRGETGTGKELTAQAIHQLSGRAGPFVAVNCGALPRTLVESELFGSKRGAFSGARDDREGLVRRADKGTLFLDEIAELPEESQVALLRVLQEGEVRPIGAADTIKVSVRIVAATHQDLETRIAEGRFRQDLYGRLLGYVAVIPPLRHRREDVGTLIGILLARLHADNKPFTLHRQAARLLLSYPFPLNVRELEQAIRTAHALSDGSELRPEHLPDAIRNYHPASPTLRPEEQAVRDRLTELLREHRGNVTAVGRALGKAPIQIRRWCRRYNLQISQFRS
jgi:DNA-binding NtrC family response regulator